MEAVMDGIGKHAEYYRAYLPDDRGVLPMAIAMGTVIALALFLYLVSAVGPVRDPGAARHGASTATVLVARHASH
jgi:hypothetical protein